MNNPHTLDDDTFNIRIPLYTYVINNQWIFKEQFTRWKKEKITLNNELEINTLI